MSNGLEFDPGFGPYIYAFRGTLEYLYADINRFKNFSQKKLKFRQYYKKILELFNNNIGFYIGCLMWAAYIKTQDEQPILHNDYLNNEYDEEANVYDINFILKFIEYFPKDAKYFINQEYKFDSSIDTILNMYKEFLIINKRFINTKNNTDILLPTSMNSKNAEGFKEIIDKVIETKDLSKLIEYKDCIL